MPSSACATEPKGVGPSKTTWDRPRALEMGPLIFQAAKCALREGDAFLEAAFPVCPGHPARRVERVRAFSGRPPGTGASCDKVAPLAQIQDPKTAPPRGLYGPLQGLSFAATFPAECAVTSKADKGRPLSEPARTRPLRRPKKRPLARRQRRRLRGLLQGPPPGQGFLARDLGNSERPSEGPSKGPSERLSKRRQRGAE